MAGCGRWPRWEGRIGMNGVVAGRPQRFGGNCAAICGNRLLPLRSIRRFPGGGEWMGCLARADWPIAPCDRISIALAAP